MKNGFTLIELLVVIAIIGVLSSVVIVSINNARMSARDATRISDAHHIALALELYFSTNNIYPPSGGATATGPNTAWSNSGVDTSWTNFAAQLDPYISSLPEDPTQSTDPNIWGASGQSYSYVRCTTSSYMFVYRLEKANGPDRGAYCGATFYRYGGAGANTNVKTIGNKLN
jgi:prepilin-type N-terminal cleavage/methylation domain-containing protein